MGLNTNAFIENLMRWAYLMYNGFLDTIEPIFELLGAEFVVGELTLSLGSLIFGAGFITLVGFTIFKFLLP